MNALLLTIFLIALGICLVLIIGVFLVGFFSVRRWQGQSREWLANSRSILRKMELDGLRVRQSIEDYYSIDDAEPFASKMNSVNETLFLIDQQTANFREEYLQVHEAMKEIRLRRFGDIFRTPFKWRKVYQQTQNMQKDENNFQHLIKVAEDHLQSLHGLGLEVAAQAQNTHAAYQEIKVVFGQLVSSGLHGGNFEKIREQMQQLQQLTESIPLLYLTSSDEEILSHTDKGMISNTYETLQQIRPLLKQQSTNLSTCNEQYQKATQEFQELQLLSGNLQKMVGSLPREISAEITTTTLNKVTSFVDRTRDRFNNPTLEDLSRITRETRQMKRIAEDLEKKYDYFFKQYHGAHELVQKLLEDVDQLHKRYLTLEKNPFSSLVWDETRLRLDSLRKQIQSIAQASPGSLSSIKDRMKIITDLNANLEELEHHFYQIEGQYTQYLTLFQKLEPQQNINWAREQRLFADKVKEYSPANWTNKQDLDFLDEVQVLEDDLTSWYPKDPAAPIQESRLPQELTHGLRIDALHQVLNQQITSLRTRLDEIGKLEEKSLQNIHQTRQELDIVTSLMHGNKSLPLQDLQKIEAFQRELDSLAVKFENRQRGRVNDKAERVEQLLPQIEKELSSQVDYLKKQLDEQRKEMKTILDHFDSIAPVDQNTVNEARRLIERSRKKAGKQNESTTSILESSTAALQRLSKEYLQQAELIAGLQKTQQPLDVAFKAFTDQQYSARQRIETISNASRGGNASSPSAHKLVKARQEFNRIEKELSFTRQQPVQVEALVSKLNVLQERYRKLNLDLGEINGRLENDQARIQHTLADLDEVVKRWEQSRRAFHGNSEVQRQVQNLLSSAKRQRLSLERQYKGGRADVDQYIHNLNELLLTTRDALIPLDEQQSINIRGEVIAQ